MVYLLRHPGKVLTHHALLGAVWGGDYTEQIEYLRVFIGQLRKKIEDRSCQVLNTSSPSHGSVIALIPET